MKKSLTAWYRLIRLPNLFALPGDILAGFLLTAGGWLPFCGAKLGFLIAASVFAGIACAILSNLADLKTDCMEHSAYPVPSGTVPIRAAVSACIAAGLLSLLFAATADIFCGLVMAALLGCSVGGNFRHNDDGSHTKTGYALRSACRFLNVAAGTVLALSMIYDESGKIGIKPQHIAIPMIYAFGLFLYAFGGHLAAADKKTVLPKRPGRKIFLTGAIVSYATLFGIVIRKPTQDWHALTCGAVSAVSAGIFLVLMYWCFRITSYPILPQQVRKCGLLMIFSLILLQTGAAAAQNSLIAAGCLLIVAVLSRFAAKMTDGGAK